VRRYELIDHLAREGGRHSIYTNPANGVKVPYGGRRFRPLTG